MTPGPDERRDEIPRDEYALSVREQMNASVRHSGHQPVAAHVPAGFRHFTRRLALLGALGGLGFASALDVGSAEGFFGSEIRKRYGTEVWSVDVSDLAVRAVDERYGTPAAAADATRLPCRDDSFDLVYSTEVIEHVLDPGLMLSEMRRVARRWVVITTPISQRPDEHEPDYALAEEGHVNNWDPETIRRLVGPAADLRSFRCNATFAGVAAVGRHLPAPFRDWFYGADHWTSQHLGGPTRRFKPLRNRDWLIVIPVEPAGAESPPGWVCPDCHGGLVEAEGGLLCREDGRRFELLAPGVPDFVIAGRAA